MRRLLFGGAIAAILALSFAGLKPNSPEPAQPGSSQSASNRSKTHREILGEAKAALAHRYSENLKNITLDVSWKPSSFALVANFTVKNGGTLPIKDLNVRCDTYGKSGTQIDTSRKKLYDRFPIGTKTVRDINMGFKHSQAVKAGCEVESFDYALDEYERETPAVKR